MSQYPETYTRHELTKIAIETHTTTTHALAREQLKAKEGTDLDRSLERACTQKCEARSGLEPCFEGTMRI
jgi:hypothetical protein